MLGLNPKHSMYLLYKKNINITIFHSFLNFIHFFPKHKRYAFFITIYSAEIQLICSWQVSGNITSVQCSQF